MKKRSGKKRVRRKQPSVDELTLEAKMILSKVNSVYFGNLKHRIEEKNKGKPITNRRFNKVLDEIRKDPQYDVRDRDIWRVKSPIYKDHMKWVEKMKKIQKMDGRTVW